MLRALSTALALFLLVVPASSDTFAPIAPGDLVECRVIEVTDGDSMVIQLRGLRVRVRLSGINCPEWNKPGGKAATAFTEAWIGHGQMIELEAAQGCFTDTPNVWDKYNRLLAFIWRDGEMLNEEILRNGHAVVKYIRGKDKYYERLTAAKE